MRKIPARAKDLDAWRDRNCAKTRRLVREMLASAELLSKDEIARRLAADPEALVWVHSRCYNGSIKAYSNYLHECYIIVYNAKYMITTDGPNGGGSCDTYNTLEEAKAHALRRVQWVRKHE